MVGAGRGVVSLVFEDVVGEKVERRSGGESVQRLYALRITERSMWRGERRCRADGCVGTLSVVGHGMQGNHGETPLSAQKSPEQMAYISPGRIEKG